MPLPDTVNVKLSSEDAGAISITRVLVQQMTLDELVERVVGVVGKDAERLGRILRSGTLLEGSTRIRWDGLDADDDEIRERLGRFPDSDPTLPFAPDRCVDAELTDSAGRSLALSKSDATAKRWFRRWSFWDALLHLTDEESPCYVSYSYRDKADRYRLTLSASQASRLRDAAGLLKHSFHARQVKIADLVTVDFLVRRASEPRA